jgi:hypothetical protein
MKHLVEFFILNEKLIFQSLIIFFIYLSYLIIRNCWHESYRMVVNRIPCIFQNCTPTAHIKKLIDLRVTCDGLVGVGVSD